MKTKILLIVNLLLIVLNADASVLKTFFEILSKPLAFTASNNTVTTPEDTDYTFALANFPYVCSNPGVACTNGISQVRVQTLPASGSLYMDNDGDGIVDAGETFVAPFVIASADIVKLKYKPVANASGSVTFTFHVYSIDRLIWTTAAGTETITITPVNDLPTSSDNSVSTNEDVNYTFAVANFPYTDVEGSAITQIQITTVPALGTLWVDADSNGLLNGAEVAVAANDVITVANITRLKFVSALNGNGNPYATFGFKVYDGTAYSNPANTMTIVVNAVNDAPTASNKTVSTFQETDYTFASSDFSFTDVDASNVLTQIQITTLETNGGLYLDNAPTNGTIDGAENIILNQVVSAADIQYLKFKPDVDESGSPYATFQFKVHDGTIYSTAAYIITVNVTLINQEPFFTKGANQVVNEDIGLISVPNWATGISAGNATENAIPQILTFYVSNTNTTLFSSQPAVSSAGTLTFTPAANKNGSATVVIYLKDDGGTTNGGDDTSPNQNFTITVNPVNDAPTISPQTFSIDENSANGSVVATVTANDVDADVLNYTITVQNPVGAFAINAATGQITVANSALLNYEVTTTCTVTVRVNDASANSSAVMTININNVNDLPPNINIGTFSTVENSSNGTTVGTVIYSEPEGDALTFSIIGGNTNGAFGINSVGEIYVANSTAVDYEGTAPTHQFLLNVQISDGVFTDNAVQTINITDANDPPRFTSTPTTIAAVGVPYTYNIVTIDDDGLEADIDILCPTKPTWLTTFIDNGNGTAILSGTPGVVNLGNNSVVLTADDIPGAIETQSFTIYVASSFTNVTFPQSIQAAINAASDGDVILVGNGTYSENIDFMGKDIAVIGDASDPTNVTINGNGIGSVVTFDAGETSAALLQGFSIINGNGTSVNLSGNFNGDSNYGGGIFINGASPSLENLLIYNNTAPASLKIGGSGGGIYVNNGGNPKLENVEVFNNYAEEYRGGGICVNNSSITITNSSIYNNTTESYGAGLSLWKSSATLNNVTFSGNQADGVNGCGGGIFLNISTINLTNVSINGNSATDGSSGVYDYGSTFTGSYSGGDSHIDIE